MSISKPEEPMNETPVVEKSKPSFFDMIVAFINQIPATISATRGAVKLLIAVFINT